MTHFTDEEIDLMFDACRRFGDRLSENDLEWVERLEEPWKAFRRLSARQLEVLEKIFDKVNK